MIPVEDTFVCGEISHRVRFFVTDKGLSFKAADVLTILGLSATQLSSVPSHERDMVDVEGGPKMELLTDLGVYNLTLAAKPQVALPLQGWLHRLEEQRYTRHLEQQRHDQHLTTYMNTAIVYIIRLKRLDGRSIIKIGSSLDIQHRLVRMANVYKLEPTLLHAFPCAGYADFERYLLNLPFLEALRFKGTVSNGKRSTEVFSVDDKELQYIVDVAKVNHCRYHRTMDSSTVKLFSSILSATNMGIPEAPESLGPPPTRTDSEPAVTGSARSAESEPLAAALQAHTQGKQISAIKKPTITKGKKKADVPTKKRTDDEIFQSSKKTLETQKPSSEYEILCALSVVTGLGMSALLTGAFSVKDASTVTYGRKVGSDHGNEEHNVKGLVDSALIVSNIDKVQKAKPVESMSTKDINLKYSNSANKWTKRLIGGGAFRDLKTVYQRKRAGITNTRSLIVDESESEYEDEE